MCPAAGGNHGQVFLGAVVIFFSLFMFCMFTWRHFLNPSQPVEDVRGAEYFLHGHAGGSLFDKLLGRELQPPWVPKAGCFGRSSL